MKTYEKLARFIELNNDGPQSCLNTKFTQNSKFEYATCGKHKHVKLSTHHEAL
jgi:hypothetical protein